MLARQFATREQTRLRAWRAAVADFHRAGGVAVWGAGAKGVTFCNLVDPESQALACVVDVNAAKQGCFVAGTGHRIVAPHNLAGARAATALVLNPNYVDEVRATIAATGLPTTAVDLMHAG
jgi:hypothetical protein